MRSCLKTTTVDEIKNEPQPPKQSNASEVHPLGLGYSSVAEGSPSICEALSSNPGTDKRKKNRALISGSWGDCRVKFCFLGTASQGQLFPFFPLVLFVGSESHFVFRLVSAYAPPPSAS